MPGTRSLWGSIPGVGIPGDREYINGQVYQGVSTPGGYTRGVGKLQASGVGIPGDGYDLMHPHTPGTEI